MTGTAIARIVVGTGLTLIIATAIILLR